MFVKNQAGNLYITDFSIQKGGFADDIDSFDFVGVFECFV